MRLILAAALAVLALPTSAQAAGLGSWNRSEQRAVVKAGLLDRQADGRFHGEARLTGAQLNAALGAVAARADEPAVAGSSTATVSVTAFDARIVAQLGLSDVAAHVQAAAARLHPPRSFGTEVVARYLGLRTNHPPQDEALELYPWDPITRAEAAHSLAVVLYQGDWAVESARAQLGAFELPNYAPATRRALSLAVSKIGMPYIWGGETDAVSSQFGYQAHGGYDCSGFVWRVFKLSGNPAGTRIGGRTAAQMAGEIRRSQRLHLDQIRPGDLLFFGAGSFRSKATERTVDHVGIALSEHWMIHSSAQGVYLQSLDDEWRRDSFTWARRIL